VAAYPQAYGSYPQPPENVSIITKAATRRGWIRKCQWLSVKYHYSNNER
jgi:hypothetical protein